MRMLLVPGAALLLGATPAVTAPAGEMIATSAAPAMCSGRERTVFSCRAGRRTISICAQGRDAAYRSGTDRRVDIQLTDAAKASTGYSGGGETQIIYRNGIYRYVVYERTVRTSFGATNAPRSDAGVVVMKSGRIISRLPCDDPDTQFDDPNSIDLPETDVIEH